METGMKRWMFHPHKDPVLIYESEAERYVKEGWSTESISNRPTTKPKQMVYHLTEAPKEIDMNEIKNYLDAGWATTPAAFTGENEKKALAKALEYHLAQAEGLRARLKNMDDARAVKPREKGRRVA